MEEISGFLAILKQGKVITSGFFEQVANLYKPTNGDVLEVKTFESAEALDAFLEENGGTNEILNN